MIIYTLEYGFLSKKTLEKKYDYKIRKIHNLEANFFIESKTCNSFTECDYKYRFVEYATTTFYII